MRLLKRATVAVGGLMLALMGCAAKPVSEKVVEAGAVRLELKGESGQVDVTRYYSHARIHDFETDQMTRARDEIVDFKVREEVAQVDTNSGHFKLKATTIAKDGMVDLHDLAFPEKGEEIEYHLSRRGQVLKAGDYPRDSVFFVPPVPLPEGPVAVGDTWTMDHAWVGLKSGIPLSVRMIGILKGVYRCGRGRCADIEVSGQVDILGMARADADYRSSIWGRMWFSLDRGTVVWSEIRSKERMVVPNSRTEILACMTSSLEYPRELARADLPVSCKPSEEVVKQSLVR